MKVKVIINSRIQKKYHREIQRSKNDHRYSYSLEYTQYPHHAKAIAKNASENGYELIIAAGGDGTVNDVINGIAGTETALSVFPAGTANDLAAYYKFSKNFSALLESIDNHNYHFPDLICVNGIYYSTCGGLGLPAKVVQTANNIRKSGYANRILSYTAGSKLYYLSVLGSLIKKDACSNKIFICENNSISYETNALSITFNNQSFLGSNIHMSPGAVNDDGLFDICLIDEQSTRIKIINLLKKITEAKHVKLPYVWNWQADEIMIRTEQSCCFFGDGELLCTGKNFHIKLIKNALKILVPDTFNKEKGKIEKPIQFKTLNRI